MMRSSRRRTTYHEAGQATIGRLLTLVCGGATIKPHFEHTGPSAPLFIGRGGRLTTMSAWGQTRSSGRWRDTSGPP
jgi:hypothetical protein